MLSSVLRCFLAHGFGENIGGALPPADLDGIGLCI